MRVSEKRRIRADRDTVWAWVSDPSRYPEFMDGVSRWAVQGDRTTGCGARWDVRLKVGAAPVGGVVEVVEYEEPGDIAWNSVTGVTMRGRWRLRERMPGTTEVDLRLAYQAPGGLMGLIADRVAEPMVRRSLRRSLRNLQMLMESRPAPRRLTAGESAVQGSSGQPERAEEPVAARAAANTATAKKTAKKATAKESAAKQPPSAKKTAAKKTTAKKTAAKKSAAKKSAAGAPREQAAAG